MGNVEVNHKVNTYRQEGLFSIPKGRIEWIDIAKCIAIILVIIGHTVKLGGGTRNFIFSFHMPLFLFFQDIHSR